MSTDIENNYYSIHFSQKRLFCVLCKYAPIEVISDLFPYTKQDVIHEGLFSAVRQKRLDVLELFVSKGIKMTLSDSWALKISTNLGYLEIIKFLVQNGAKISANEYQPFKNAIQRGYLDIIKFFMDEGITLENNHWAINTACSSGPINIVHFLVDKGANIRNHDDTPIRYATDKGQLEIVKYLVKKGANVNAGENYALRKAVGNGYLKIVKYLIKKGADVNINNPLRGACRYGHFKTTKFLIKKGADVLAEDCKNLILASKSGSLEIVELLVARDSSICKANNAAMAAAISHGNLDIVKYLITKGGDIHAQNNYLSTAASKGYFELVYFLLDYGLNIHIDDDSPLKLAAENGSSDVVGLLIENGANVTAGENYALRKAVENGNSDITHLLLEKGADVHVKDNCCLKISVKYERFRMIKLLLSYGADIKVINNDMLNKVRNRGIYDFLKEKLKPFHLWKKVRKSIISNKPRTKWQSIKLDDPKDKIILRNIIKRARLFTKRKNKSYYSTYLLKVQLAIQMVAIENVPLIIYDHIDCNNLMSPICHELNIVPEYELIKDKYNNWYHITDLIDENGNWKMNKNPYTKEPWEASLSYTITKARLQKRRKNYKVNKLKEIHELIIDIDIHFNAIRTIMIELDKSTNSNHLDQIEKINPFNLFDFFKKEVVSLEYFRRYTNEELNSMSKLSSNELFHKFLVITRTIMTDVNFSSYIGYYLEEQK